MIKPKILILLYIFSLLINYPYSVESYKEPNDELIDENNSEYRSIDDLLKELKEERKLINQQKLDEINQKNTEKQRENGETPEEAPKETTKPKKDTNNENIPKLIVRLRGKHSPKYLCSYRLTVNDDIKDIELSKEVINDYNILMKKPSLKVRPGEIINFEFTPNCKSLNAHIWDDENNVLDKIKVKRGCIEVPNLDKKIVIIVTGNFSNGYIKYGIVLDIRK